MIDSDPNLIFVKDAEGKFLLANAAMAKAYGQTTESIVGKYNWQLTDNLQETREYDRVGREVIDTGREVAMQQMASLPSEKSRRTFQTIRKPLVQDDGTASVLTFAMDITELKEAEEGLRRLNRSLKLLGECNAAMVRIRKENQLLAEICKLVVETGGYRMAWVGFAEHELVSAGDAPRRNMATKKAIWISVAIRWSDSELGRGPTGMAIKKAVTQVNQDTRTDILMAPWRGEALAQGYLSSIALPLKEGSKPFGAITIYAAEAGAFNPDEVKLLEELAGNLAYGIKSIRTANERAEAGVQIENERIRLRTLVQSIPDLVWLKDAEGKFLACNNRLEQLMGRSEAEIIGKTDYDFFDRELADFFRKNDRRAMESNRLTINEEWLTFASDGYRGLFETIKTPLRDLYGNLIGVLGIARDITERITLSKAVQELHDDLDTTLKAIPDLLFELDKNGRYLNIWTQHPDLLPETKERMRGYAVNQTLPPDAAATVMRALREADENGYSSGQVYKLNLPQGISWFELSTAVKTPNDDSGKRFIMLARDITERKRVEEELKFKNLLLTTEHECSIDGILVVDEAGRIISYNHRFIRIWGISEEIVSSGVDELVLEAALSQLDDPKQFLEKVRYLYKHRDTTSRDELYLRDGRVLERYTAPLNGSPGEYFGRIWFFRDITELKRSEKNLARSYEQLQRLTMRLENTREDERAKIALDLHDEMGATLAAIKMGVAWLASKLPGDLPGLADETVHINELVSDGINTMHRIVSQLRPDVMSETGLADTISDYVTKFQHHTKINCLLRFSVQEIALNEDQSNTIFRILQEALNNVVKHAQAGKVDIVLVKRAESLMMVVKDNGIGFDATKRKREAYGLLGIKERALMVGGKARINSRPGKGTRVSISIPLINDIDQQ